MQHIGSARRAFAQDPAADERTAASGHRSVPGKRLD
jgi:hypothetical protein